MLHTADMNLQRIEFYREGEQKPFVDICACAVPRKGEQISIARTLFRILAVSWAVDFSGSGDPREIELRANVILRLVADL